MELILGTILGTIAMPLLVAILCGCRVGKEVVPDTEAAVGCCWVLFKLVFCIIICFVFVKAIVGGYLP